MWRWFVLALALWGCEQKIGTTSPSDSRPSIVSACSEGLNSEPVRDNRDRDRTPIIVNIPRPDPTINCTRSSGSATE